MKTLVTSAVALTLTSVPGFASETDWSQLDKEVEALTASLAQNGNGGPSVSGFLQTFYGYTGVPGPVDIGGFWVPNARIELEGDVADYHYRVEYNFAALDSDGPVDDPATANIDESQFDRSSQSLLDAFLHFPLGGINGTVGQFKPPVLQGSLTNRDELTFFSRSVMGEVFAARDQGAMVSGQFDQVAVWLAVMNGGPEAGIGTVGDALFFAGRVSVDLLGEGVSSSAQGSLGGTRDPSATAGLSYFDDDATNAAGVAIDGVVSTDVYSFGGELLALRNETGSGAGNTGMFYARGLPSFLGLDTGRLNLAEDSMPWSATGTYMLVPDTWEVAARYQELDNGSVAIGQPGAQVGDVAINHYMNGHALKWTLQYTRIFLEQADDLDVVAFGATLSY